MIENVQYITKDEVAIMIADMENNITAKLDDRLAHVQDSTDKIGRDLRLMSSRLEMLREKTAWGEVGGPSTMDIIILSVVVATGIVTVAVQFPW